MKKVKSTTKEEKLLAILERIAVALETPAKFYKKSEKQIDMALKFLTTELKKHQQKN